MTEQDIIDRLKRASRDEPMPKEIMELAARALFNLERIANALEVSAGIRKIPMVPSVSGLDSGQPQS